MSSAARATPGRAEDRPRPAGRQRFLLVEEVAEELRTDVWSIRRRIRRGELPAVRDGKRYLIPAAALDAYVEALPRAATP